MNFHFLRKNYFQLVLYVYRYGYLKLNQIRDNIGLQVIDSRIMTDCKKDQEGYQSLIQSKPVTAVSLHNPSQ